MGRAGSGLILPEWQQAGLAQSDKDEPGQVTKQACADLCYLLL